MDRIAIFPGSFDPFTVGHESIVRRALSLFDKIIIAIGVNRSKQPFFPLAQRMETLRQLYAHEQRVEIASYETLTIDFAKQMNARFILRGLRSVYDFEYERDIAEVNRQLASIETILLFTERQYACISSSLVRELISYGKDASAYLPHIPNKP